MKTVEDILMVKGPDVIVASPATTVLEAAELMVEADVGSVIVRDGQAVEGIFSERDLLSRVVARGRDPSRTLLAEVMSAPVKSCRLADSLETCHRLLTESHIRHLAVIEEDALAGLISLRDVLTAMPGE